ncbi:hypothetical protein [Kurthia sibirica]|uniref:Uncharacterized protein n=1 Tax=Kurthia sibirica TaxID=202750 RepID=A0A2U3API3_9BACL|nr:hypothetical protein [Kurthia sibirica]PWI26434.1 hypothetical protein DEX24_03630 [Kurthia sibirica]GEK32999.1 hypothetical protein KSI01_05320 [Kurthia sibirica]
MPGLVLNFIVGWFSFMLVMQAINYSAQNFSMQRFIIQSIIYIAVFIVIYLIHQMRTKRRKTA